MQNTKAVRNMQQGRISGALCQPGPPLGGETKLFVLILNVKQEIL